MTGFNSKRRTALAKLPDDDDTQMYDDTLTIVYQQGFADGKRSAQRKPLTDEEIQSIHDTYYRRMGRMEFARAIEAAHNIKE
jgi:hypothetical protein